MSLQPKPKKNSATSTKSTGMVMAVVVYYTKKGKNVIVTEENLVDNLFKKYKRYGVRELGKPTCCKDCKYTSCWDYGKAKRCSEKETKR
jgi:predicted Zn-ribbon and HTH transcriptional regulator